MLKRIAGGKKGKLLCCKCIFHQSKAKSAEIQPKNHQNVQKTNFLQKVPGVNGLMFFDSTISLPSFNGLRCKLAKIALFIYMM